MDMFVLHGHWLLPTQPEERGHFSLWAETSEEELPKRRGRAPKVPQHPFAATPQRLHQVLKPLVPLPATPTPTSLSLLLPAFKALPLPSPHLVHDWEALADATTTGLRRFKLEGLSLKATDALHLLPALPAPEELPPHLAPGDDLIFWSTVARFALEILAGLRARRATAEEEEASPDPTALPAEETAPAPLPEDPDAFWRLSQPLDDFQVQPRAPEVPLSLLQRLGDPSFAPINLRSGLGPAYQAVTERAEALAFGEEGED